MYQTSDIRKNLKIKMDGAPWIVVDFQFVKPGKGVAFTRTKLKNMITGQVVEKTFRTGDSLESVDLEVKKATMMYAEGDTFNFMDLGDYEQFPVTREQIGEGARWLIDNMECELLFYEGRVVTVDLPNFVDVEVTYCEPAVKGDTATNTTKAATVSSGGTVQVPLFVAQGEKIRIDTRTSAYVSRVK